MFKQRVTDDTEEAADVRVYSKWLSLAANEQHTWAFFDSDVADCAGTALTGSTIGDGFTTDADGKGKMRGKFDSVSLSGDDSIIGKYLQLSDSGDNEVACCLVEEGSGRKGRKGRKGGKGGKGGKKNRGRKLEGFEDDSRLSHFLY